jgi:hypothetical protein
MQSRRVSFSRLSMIFQACLAAWIGPFQFHTQAQPTTIYSTGFEPVEGFDDVFTLVGKGGWTSIGSDGGVESSGSGIVTNFFGGQGQQAYVGFTPLTGTNDTLSVWRPLNVDPAGIGKPIVRFSVSLAVFDSTNEVYDCFRWSVYNSTNGGERLFTVEFDNSTLEINYLLDDGIFTFTGFTFENEGIYDLEVVMNFTSNRWSAMLNDTLLVSSKPITTQNAVLTLGDIDAVWVYGPYTNAPGNNFMVFDDYKVTAEALPFHLQSQGHLPNGSFILRLTGEQARDYAIEASTNLMSWTSIKTNNATDGTFDFVDTSATGVTRRFYRARLVP